MLSRLSDTLFSAFFGTFQRMLFGELLRVFLLCLLALSGVFTLVAVLQQFQQGSSLTQVAKILPLLTVTLIPYIVPPACLFASCVVYGRLAHDNEAVALKAAGVDLYTTLRPTLLLGLVAGGGTAAIQFGITPYAWRTKAELVMDEPEEAICLALKRERVLQFPGGKDRQYVVYVRDVEDRRLSDVVVKVRSAAAGKSAGDVELVARTREARLKVILDKNLVQLEGAWAWTGGSRSGNDPFEAELPQRFNLASERARLKYNPAMVGWLDLPRAAAERSGERDKVAGIRDALAALPADQSLTADEQSELAERLDVRVDQVPVDAAGRPSQLQHLTETVKSCDRDDRVLRYEYHFRPAMAFGCLFFALLGCPVGLWASRADYLSTFAILFLPALVVYYPVLFMAGGYARDGKIPMAAGVWAANAVLALVSVILSWRLIRR